jgi:protein phosphatase
VDAATWVPAVGTGIAAVLVVLALMAASQRVARSAKEGAIARKSKKSRPVRAPDKPEEPARAPEASVEDQAARPSFEDRAARRAPTPRVSWDVSRPNAGMEDDEDITIVRAIPVFDDADVSVDGAEAIDASPHTDPHASRIHLCYEADAEAEEVTSASARILLYAAGDSDRGRVRARNEDSVLVMPERSLFAVADGMGGHRGGEVASSLAIDTLEDAFSRSAFEGQVESDENVPRRARELASAVQMTNECVHAMATADRALSGMGTTLVAARFSPNKQRLYVGHVGDSRCYRLRGGVLRQLTTDHTMAALGMKGPHAKDLFQAVGVNERLVIDLIVDKPQDGDVYLLCSDGLSKMLPDHEIRDVLVEQEDLESALYTLIEHANDRGGNDNVTIVIVKVLDRVSKKALDSLSKQASNG